MSEQNLEGVDLFESYELQPKALKKIVDKYGEFFTYHECKEFLKEVEAIGFTFDYGLDGEPFELRAIK